MARLPTIVEVAAESVEVKAAAVDVAEVERAPARVIKMAISEILIVILMARN